MFVEKESLIHELTYCYHCGNSCDNSSFPFDEKYFCCQGCVLVYDILKENRLTSYYTLNKSPGTLRKKQSYQEQYAYLDNEKIRKRLILFSNKDISTVTFRIPQMHCSSCIWLLENLYRINTSIVKSLVNFNRKEVTITFEETKVSLRQLVELLVKIGYEPLINLNENNDNLASRKDKTVAYKIGIAGFCFGNIMLFSFPEYFSSGNYTEAGFKGVFSYLNFLLSLPVFFYCSSEFFQSAWSSLKYKFLNIDVPIALGILVMFVRSAYEIISGSGAGYMDTMSGLVFFMLVGRTFQNKTYDTISFERDYKSFFPISVMVRKNSKETSIPVSDLTVGDKIIIRNEELIPADSVLAEGEGNIDYSFVTGESLPTLVKKGELIYAGGKHTGTLIELDVVKKVSQSYLTQLWNQDAYKNTTDENRFQQLVNNISHYFTIVLISIALLSLAWWASQNELSKGLNAFTAVLIIACPCALAISSPFTLGNILRSFSRNNFYVKNYSVIEKLAKINTIVFDKTGTLTKTNSSKINFTGDELTNEEWSAVRSLLHHSAHPLSRMLETHLKNFLLSRVLVYNEKTGQGIDGIVNDQYVRIGSAPFCGIPFEGNFASIKIFVSINNKIKGHFSISNEYRDKVNVLAEKLTTSGYELIVLSGDHAGEKQNLEILLGKNVKTYFNQSPSDKLTFIQSLQQENKKVLVIGDGLNDAGALKQSDVGITVSDDTNNFSPACDGILKADSFSLIPGILQISKASHRIILASFGISILYNIIGLAFAVTANLSPVIAAILMPLSAVTIISFTTGVSNWYARRMFMTNVSFAFDNHHNPQITT